MYVIFFGRALAGWYEVVERAIWKDLRWNVHSTNHSFKYAITGRVNRLKSLPANTYRKWDGWYRWTNRGVNANPSIPHISPSYCNMWTKHATELSSKLQAGWIVNMSQYSSHAFPFSVGSVLANMLVSFKMCFTEDINFDLRSTNPILSEFTSHFVTCVRWQQGPFLISLILFLWTPQSLYSSQPPEP